MYPTPTVWLKIKSSFQQGRLPFAVFPFPLSPTCLELVPADADAGRPFGPLCLPSPAVRDPVAGSRMAVVSGPEIGADTGRVARLPGLTPVDTARRGGCLGVAAFAFAKSVLAFRETAAARGELASSGCLSTGAGEVRSAAQFRRLPWRRTPGARRIRREGRRRPAKNDPLGAPSFGHARCAREWSFNRPYV